MKVTWTQYEGSITNLNGQVRTEEFSELYKVIRDKASQICAKKDAGYFICGPAGEGRKNNTVKETCLLSLDADNAGEWNDFLKYLEDQSISYIAYRTPSHGIEGACKWRCVIPLRNPIDATELSIEYPRIIKHYAKVGKLAEAGFDKRCRNPARAFYFPCRPIAEIPPREVRVFYGGTLDIKELIDSGALPKKEKTSGAKLSAQDFVLPTGTSVLMECFKKLQEDEPHIAWIGEVVGEKTFVRCPNNAKHTNPLDEQEPPTSSTAILGAILNCMHEHCEHLKTINDLVKNFGDKFSPERVEKAKTKALQNSETYTVEELEQISKFIRGAGGDMIWVLDHKGSYYFKTTNGFEGPIVGRETSVYIAIKDYLAKAPVQRYEMTQKGVKELSGFEIVKKHSTTVENVILDMRGGETFFNTETKTLYKRVYVVRSTPTLDHRISEWLRIFGGKDHLLLLEWLSMTMLLDRPQTVLYLHGPPGTGKTTLIEGVAHIWGCGAAKMERVFGGNFNEGVLKNPIIAGNEGMHGVSSSKLREFVGDTSHTINQKNVPVVEAIGCPRVMISANNLDGLTFSKEINTKADTEAVAQRFVTIEVNGEATEWFAKKGIVFKYEEIANHVHALNEIRGAEIPTGRFLTTRPSPQLLDQILNTEARSSVVCAILEILAMYLRVVKGSNTDATKMSAIPGNGVVLVNLDGVFERLEGKPKNTLTKHQVAKEIKNMSRFGESKVKRIAGALKRVWEIEENVLTSVNKTFGIVDEDKLGELVNRQLDYTTLEEITGNVVLDFPSPTK